MTCESEKKKSNASIDSQPKTTHQLISLQCHELENEPLEDAYRDLAGYCILKLIEMRKDRIVKEGLP